MCNRPFTDLDDMHSKLIKQWNSQVKKNEQVYVLGDFSFGGKAKTKAILDQLNGQKILVWGNHDRDAKWMLEAGFDRVYDNIYIELNPGKQKVFLSDFRYYPSLWKRLFSKKHDLRYLHKRIVDNGEWLLHGHTHSENKIYKLTFIDKIINFFFGRKRKEIHVGVEAWDYKLVPHTTILKMIEENK